MLVACVILSIVLLAAGFVLALYRIARGPSLPDRVVAFEVVGSVSIGTIAVHDVATSQPVYLDAVVVVALIAFLGSVAFARYLERRMRDD